MIELYIVRHGETDYNVQKRFQGQLDIPLNTKGEQQAQLVRRRLEQLTFDAVYTSDLLRASQTARLALEGHSAASLIEPSELLREIKSGVFEGLTWDEIASRYPHEAEMYTNSDRQHYTPPGAEPLPDVLARVANFVKQLRERFNTSPARVLAFAHGGTISLLLSHLMGIELKRAWSWKIENCALTHIDLFPDGNVRMVFFGDNHHMLESVFAEPPHTPAFSDAPASTPAQPEGKEDESRPVVV